MEDSTRDAIDSILAGKKRRYTAPPRPAPGYDPISAYEKERSEAERLYGKYKPKAHLPGAPTWCYNEEEKRLVNMKDEVATLSVDTSSASVIFKAPLNDHIIQRITDAVPLTQRQWMPDKQSWRFSPAAIPILKPILRDEYKDVQMLGVPKALPSTKFDQLINKLTKEDKAAVYRLLASKYHPDKGGSHEVMTLINMVFRG